jgi:hypothetical protein
MTLPKTPTIVFVAIHSELTNIYLCHIFPPVCSHAYLYNKSSSRDKVRVNLRGTHALYRCIDISLERVYCEILIKNSMFFLFFFLEMSGSKNDAG